MWGQSARIFGRCGQQALFSAMKLKAEPATLAFGYVDRVRSPRRL
jgi:hypothetical protein